MSSKPEQIPLYAADGKSLGFRTIEAASRLIAGGYVKPAYGRKGHLKAIWLGKLDANRQGIAPRLNTQHGGSRSRQIRNAARVFPEPVGAEIRTSWRRGFRAADIESQRASEARTRTGMQAQAGTTEEAAAQAAAGLSGTQRIRAAEDLGSTGISAAERVGETAIGAARAVRNA